jgi:hypothetical protein
MDRAAAVWNEIISVKNRIEGQTVWPELYRDMLVL